MIPVTVNRSERQYVEIPFEKQTCNPLPGDLFSTSAKDMSRGSKTDFHICLHFIDLSPPVTIEVVCREKS